ncbi:MAG: hypothetical protein R2880_14530 [Deinococcales bacterium]
MRGMRYFIVGLCLYVMSAHAQMPQASLSGYSVYQGGQIALTFNFFSAQNCLISVQVISPMGQRWFCGAWQNDHSLRLDSVEGKDATSIQGQFSNEAFTGHIYVSSCLETCVLLEGPFTVWPNAPLGLRNLFLPPR